MSTTKKPVAIAVSAALASGLLLSGSAFASTPLVQGYLLGADAAGTKAAEGNCGGDKAAEAKCGADKGAEGKCGEGTCGMAKMDTDKDGKLSRAEFAAAHSGKDDKFAAHDGNKDGFISAEEMKAAHEGSCGADKKAAEGKCGEGKCGGDKPAADTKAAEGKCGEGKCGGSM